MRFNIGDIFLVQNVGHCTHGQYFQLLSRPVQSGTRTVCLGCLINPVTLQPVDNLEYYLNTEHLQLIPTEMQEVCKEPETPSNVVSLATWKRSPKATKENCTLNKLLRSNLDKIARLKKERDKDNKSVIRAYRLKK
jgi:hypothetical protein